MTTPELIESLNAGDTVELSRTAWPEHVMTGVLHEHDGALYAGPTLLRHPDGKPHAFVAYVRVEVVKRAASLLYVNSARTEPMDGDVVRDADDQASTTTWQYDSYLGVDDPDPWTSGGSSVTNSRDELPARLLLLVDGETGRTVT